MNSKENKKYTAVLMFIIIIWTSILAIYYLTSNKPISYATSSNYNIQISNAESIDLEKIIAENTKVYTSEEIIKEIVELEYITKYRNNDEMLKGTTKVSQEGRNGTQEIIIKKEYDEQGNLINEEQLSATVVKSSINKIIDVGTADRKTIESKYAKKATSAGLSFDMALNKSSGFSLEQFQKALTDNKDTNKIFENNSEYFYLIEQQYNINGMFVAAVGIHESAWGTSKIAQDKHNLFGYGAYDSNPYNGAYSFESYSESIDLIARVFVKYYINPAGTKIYDGSLASGKYFSGSTLFSINKKYATDKNWANSVYKHMQYLYGKV